MNKEGQGRPEGALTLKEQGNPNVAAEGGQDYSSMLSSIRADQDMETFVADLRQNKDQLLPFCKWLMKKTADKLSERWMNLNLGVCVEYVLKEHFWYGPF